jgi:hypothetical protein
MFSEILKIKPQLDAKDLSNMERTLSSRFSKVAKKFGGGIMSVLKGGGIAGIALGLIDKLLNPLKETTDAMERILKMSDDVVTNAKQFGTSSGQLFRLIKFAQAAGLEQDNLFQLITKFQTAVAEAKSDPTKQTSVRNFVGVEDSAAGFFEFIQSLQKMGKTQQLLVQQEVFGEKQILKMADFLQTDFGALEKRLGLKNANAYNPALEKLGNLNDLRDERTAAREARDLLVKGRTLNEGMVLAEDRAKQIELNQENARLASYQNLQAISDTTTKIMGLVEQGLAQLGKFISFVTPAINRIVDTLSKLSGSRVFKSFFGGEDK